MEKVRGGILILSMFSLVSCNALPWDEFNQNKAHKPCGQRIMVCDVTHPKKKECYCVDRGNISF